MNGPDWRLTVGDCLDVLRALPADSVDSIVCDPPYGLGFMGKKWDAMPPGVEWAEACLRVLKPGGHLVAFGGTRTVHRLAMSIEDAGAEIRDTLAWVYFSGFPKSLNLGHKVPAWAGWGTAVKPAHEPAVLARKPLAGTVAETVLAYGTGAINVDACRLQPGDLAWVGPTDTTDRRRPSAGGDNGLAGTSTFKIRERRIEDQPVVTGRYPANLYQCPKAQRRERERGCDGLPPRAGHEAVERKEGSAGLNNPRAGAGRTARQVRNYHPTVKPARVLRWLCRLVTPPGGLVLDPFAGSGSCGVAAVLEGFRYHGIEIDPSYADIARARIGHAAAHPLEWTDTAPGAQRAKGKR